MYRLKVLFYKNYQLRFVLINVFCKTNNNNSNNNNSNNYFHFWGFSITPALIGRRCCFSGAIPPIPRFHLAWAIPPIWWAIPPRLGDSTYSVGFSTIRLEVLPSYLKTNFNVAIYLFKIKYNVAYTIEQLWDFSTHTL